MGSSKVPPLGRQSWWRCFLFPICSCELAFKESCELGFELGAGSRPALSAHADDTLAVGVESELSKRGIHAHEMRSRGSSTLVVVLYESAHVRFVIGKVLKRLRYGEEHGE